MTDNLKQIVITGASRGIGRAIARRLSAKGRKIVLSGRNQQALAETKKMVRVGGADAIVAVSDLTTIDGVEVLSAAVDGPLDVVVNNAGIAIVKPIEDLTLEDWQTTINANVTAPFLLIKRLLPQIASGGAVVNILSIAAKTGFPSWSAYCMSKFAMEGFSQSLREELRPRGIRVINVYPSATKTELWENVAGDWPTDKMLDPGEVAEAVAYALSRPASVAIENISVGNIAGTL